MRTKLLFLISILILFASSISIFGQVPNLKTVSDFIIFTSNGALSNTGATIIAGGDIGTNVGAVSGFTVDNSTIHNSDTKTQQCSLDLMDLFNEIKSIPTTITIPAGDLPLHGTYTPGVYSIGLAVTLGSTLTLDGQNNPNALFIFKVTGAFSAAAGTKIILKNGALAKNVYFNVDGAICFGANASLKGNFISLSGAIDLGAGAKLEGKALTNTGAITLYENIVMSLFTPVPICTVIQPTLNQPTGTITILYPRAIGMTYSINGTTYTNTSGIFTTLPPGTYNVSAKDAIGSISESLKIKIVPYLNLGVNSNFAIFTQTGVIENKGDSTKVTGNIGNQTGIINFSKGRLCGQIHSGDSTSTSTANDLLILNTYLTNCIPDSIISTVFGYGQIFHPKTYGFGAALTLNGNITLDAQGDPNALFIFKIVGAFNTAPNSNIILINGASINNVYWQIDGAVTIGENTIFKGDIVSTGAIILNNGTTLTGRALSTTGAITLNDYVTISILPRLTITLIQPTFSIITGTIIVKAPLGNNITYSINEGLYSNTTGIFPNLPKGSYTIRANSTECICYPDTIVLISSPTWEGSLNNDWNNPANWSSNSIPTSNQDIIIANVLNSPVINLGTGLTANCNNLTIEPGAAFTIFTNNILTVAGSIKNLAGTSGIVIKASSLDGIPNGSLIFHNSAIDSVSATVEMYSKASWDKSQIEGSIYKWQFFGIPIRSVKANPTFAGSYVRKAYESGNSTATSWVQLQNDSILTKFTGYEIVQEAPKIFTFKGVLENENFTKTLSYTPGASYPGQHLIVNPYTAAIDITKLNFGTQMEASVYFYNSGTFNDWKNSNALKYDSMAINPGQYIVSTKLTAGMAPGIPAQIPSMQAFLVKALSNSSYATLEIPYSSVALKNEVKQTAPGIQKRTSAKLNMFTRIDVKGSRFADRMWIFTIPTCTHSFDNGWDGRKFLGSPLTPQIFAMEDDEIYQINVVDNINNSYLGFIAGEDTKYTLTISNENDGKVGPRIYLQDLIENKVIEITKSGTEYSFEAPQSSIRVKRFKILTSPYINDKEVTEIQFQVFTSKESIFIHNFSNFDGNLIVYDMSGRCMQKSTFGANKITILPTSLPTGAFIIHAISKSGKEQKQLVMI